MKIAFLTPEYPNSKTSFSGGIGTSIMNLCKGLIIEGHEITILLYGQNKDETFFDNGIRIQKIKNIKLKGFSRYLTQKKIQKYGNDLIKKNQIDIIESIDWTGITSNINFKCPLVIKLHGSDTYFCYLDKRPVKYWNKLQEKKALKKADALISVSQFTANVTKRLFSLNKEITVIPNSIDIELFKITDRIEIQNNTILYFGTLIRKKGLLELPHIFNEVIKKNKNIKLILIGRDAPDIITGNISTWEMMKDLFDKEAFKNVNYLGSVPYNEIIKHISIATVCVFPTFAEALPVSWIEAMAMQKAIVASDIGWANEVIDDEINGFLVSPQDHNKYALRILQLIDNPNLQIKFGIEARKKVIKKFSLKIVVQQTLMYYKKIISSYN